MTPSDESAGLSAAFDLMLDGLAYVDAMANRDTEASQALIATGNVPVSMCVLATFLLQQLFGGTPREAIDAFRSGLIVARADPNTGQETTS